MSLVEKLKSMFGGSSGGSSKGTEDKTMSKVKGSRATGNVVVVGGGVAGIQASLDLADRGMQVYLVERSPSIGGRMAQLDKTFPTNDCSMCILSPKMADCYRHPNINVLTYSELQEVDGVVDNFKVKILRKARYVKEDVCTGCGACVEACLLKGRIPNEFDMGLAKRGAIYFPFLQAVPRVATVDNTRCLFLTKGKCGKAPACSEACQLGAIDLDMEDEVIGIPAGAIILCPGIDICNPAIKAEYGYGIYPNVVSSLEFERILSASGPFAGHVVRQSDDKAPEKIAFIQCVCSRDTQVEANYCSSVCCMYATKEAIIAKEHSPNVQPTIFFMDMRAFGKEFDYYYERAQDEYGVVYNRCRVASIKEGENNNPIVTYVGSEGEVTEEKFDMVILSVGIKPSEGTLQMSEKLGIDLNNYDFCSTGTFTPLETSRPGIFVAGAFSAPKDIPDTVAQASGAASKAAAAMEVTKRIKVAPQEAGDEKDVSGQEPRIGVFVCHCGINIGGVVDVPAVDEYAKTLENVVFTTNNMYTCAQDALQLIKEKINEFDLDRVVVASCTPRTHEPLFRSTCKEAGLNPYLFEMANIRDQCSWIHMNEPDKATQKAKDLVRMAVAKARLLQPLSTSYLDVNDTAVVIGGGISGMTAALDLAEQGFMTHLVERESELGGNLRNRQFLATGEDPQAKLKEIIGRVESSKLIKVHKSTEVKNVDGFVGNFKTTLSKGGKDEEIEHGVVIVATGAREYVPDEYMYGKSSNVLTQTELEGALARGEVPDTTVMIQCVGSRNEDRPYCSKICCTEAVKNALKIKELKPDADVYILYRDMRTYGFKEDFYRDASEKGVRFLRYDLDSMPEAEEDGDMIRVTVTDPVLNDKVVIGADKLALSNAVVAHPETEELARMLKVPQSKDGFFLEAHMKLRPVDFATEGVFLAGMAHWPKFIEECISQASGAAARAATILSKTQLEAEGITAEVNDELCTGCGICEPICEYKAITMEVVVRDGVEYRVSSVNEGLCKGCGTCVGACPSGAMQQKGFNDVQIVAMIDTAAERV